MTFQRDEHRRIIVVLNEVAARPLVMYDVTHYTGIPRFPQGSAGRWCLSDHVAERDRHFQIWALGRIPFTAGLTADDAGKGVSDGPASKCVSNRPREGIAHG